MRGIPVKRLLSLWCGGGVGIWCWTQAMPVRWLQLLIGSVLKTLIICRPMYQKVSLKLISDPVEKPFHLYPLMMVLATHMVQDSVKSRSH